MALMTVATCYPGQSALHSIFVSATMQDILQEGSLALLESQAHLLDELGRNFISQQRLQRQASIQACQASHFHT